MKYCASCGQCLSDNCDVCPVCGHDASDASEKPEKAYEAEKYVRSGVKYSYIKPKVTLALIVINVLIYIVIKGLEFMGCDLASVFSMHRGAVFSGQFYRLITSMFTHRELFHLLSNCYALYIYGMMLEPALGKARFVLVYFVSGLLGNFLTFGFMSNPSIGASGAIFGLLGAVIAIYFINPTTMNRMMMKNVMACVVITTLYSLGGGVNNLAHFGGLFGGYMMLCVVISVRHRKRIATSGVLMAVILVICFAGSVFSGVTKVRSAVEKQYGNWTAMCFVASLDGYEIADRFAEEILADEDGIYSADAAAVKVILSARKKDARGLEENSKRFFDLIEKDHRMMCKEIYKDLENIHIK